MIRIRLVRQITTAFLGIFALFTLPQALVVGQIIAFDNGNPSDSDPREGFVNTAYADGWDEDDNGGYGFGPWTGLYGNPVESDVDAPEPDNGLTTPAFRLGTGGYGSGAFRTFAVPMQAGQTFKVDFDPFAFPTGPHVVTSEFQSLFRFSSAAGERFALYAYAYYNPNGTIQFGSDKWGVGGATANDNLNLGAPLPTSPCYATGCTNYSLLDSSDGFTLTLDIPTINTYRLRVDDDGVTKLDISGQLAGGATAGQGLTNLYIWSKDGAGATIDTSYFTNMQIIETPSEDVDGDYNDDGKVDAADYVVWRKSFGTGSDLPNDPNPTPIDDDQYSTWRLNFGRGSGGGSGGVVPEPATLALIVLGTVAGAMRHRQARQR